LRGKREKGKGGRRPQGKRIDRNNNKMAGEWGRGDVKKMAGPRKSRGCPEGGRTIISPKGTIKGEGKSCGRQPRRQGKLTKISVHQWKRPAEQRKGAQRTKIVEEALDGELQGSKKKKKRRGTSRLKTLTANGHLGGGCPARTNARLRVRAQGGWGGRGKGRCGRASQRFTERERADMGENR